MNRSESLGERVDPRIKSGDDHGEVEAVSLTGFGQRLFVGEGR